MPSFRYHAYRVVFRHLRVPPGTMRPYALPGAAALHERRWRRRLAKAPVMTSAEHAAAVGVRDIEEPVGCVLCEEQRIQPLLRPRGYHVVRCVGCGLLFRHPGIRPERLSELYSGRYDRFLTGAYSRNRRRRYELVLDAFAPRFDEGGGRRLLDFGCGAGQFLELAAERGFRATGIDLSEGAVERARAAGLDAYSGTPAAVPAIAAGGFDVVTLWSVLAHLATPVEDLAALRELLAPGGVAMVLTVNAESLQLKRDGERWNGFTPNHLRFYGPSTLPRLFQRAGFGPADVRPMYGDLVETGRAPLTARQERRLRRTIDAGNRGNMLRAVVPRDG